MKDILKKISKKQILVILFIVLIIAVYEFVLTLPSKYLGRIVDKLLSINNQMTPENIAGLKTNIKFMVLGSFGVVAGILIWRFVIAMSTRTFQKNLTDEGGNNRKNCKKRPQTKSCHYTNKNTCKTCTWKEECDLIIPMQEYPSHT